MDSTYFKIVSILLCAVLLTGCLYPRNQKAQNQIPNEDQLELVQSAVDKYQKDMDGLVPIKTKPSETPIFEKYLIDFNLLIESNFLSTIPSSAFENGGKYQYALITPDDNPRVKLIDLQITEEIRKVNVKLDIYRSKHVYPPFGQEIENGIFYINYKKLGLKHAPYVTSPFTKENLPIIMDTNGQLYVDYRIDLNHALKEFTHSYKDGDDIRMLLAENYPFIPAYSLPYRIHDGEPKIIDQ